MQGRFNHWMRLGVASCLVACLFFVGTGSVTGQSAKGAWDSRFTLPPGIDGPVSSMVSMGNFLLVGGSFSHAGNVEAHNLALWDGGHWMPFAGGVNGPVSSLVLNNVGLFVSGTFTRAGAVSAQGIAKWNGFRWEGVNANPLTEYNYAGTIDTLYWQAGNLYVGGSFSKIGGVSSRGIARWDGRAWHDMEGGVSIPDYAFASVYTITGDGTNIYAGGFFTQAGSVQATNLARWNGRHWEGIGNFAAEPPPNVTFFPALYSQVDKVMMNQGSLYVCGQFSEVDGYAITNFAKWNRGIWQKAGDVDGQVNGMDEYMGGLLVAGTFRSIGGVSATNAAWFKQGRWSGLGVNTSGSFYDVKVAGNHVYLAGSFDLVNGVSARSIIRYDGGKFSALGTGKGNSLSGPVEALATDGTNVYALGNFDTAGTAPVSGLAKWDGTKWSGLGKPFDSGMGYRSPGFNLALGIGRNPGNLPGIAAVGSKLYFNGRFEMPDVGGTNLACWNGREWSAVGNDQGTWEIESMASDGKNLFVSGELLNDFQVVKYGVNAWDGTNWTEVPWNGNFNFPLLAMDGTNLYMAKAIFSRTSPPGIGNPLPSPQPPTPLPPRVTLPPRVIPPLTPTIITTPQSITPRVMAAAPQNFTVAKWDGQTFTDYGEIPGLAYVSALAAQGNTIYVAGSSTNYSGISLLFRWDGSAWEQVAVPFAGRYAIESIVLKGQKIYLGGYFTTADGILLDGLKEWDGFGWKSLGITNGYVSSMVASGNKLFVGGSFSTVGGTRSGNFGIWTEGR
jgi:trimeric autotransporter adhesin